MAIIDVKIENQIAKITFNRPESLNALNSEVLSTLYTTLKNLQGSKDVSILIFTGSEDKAFIAGADIKEMLNLNRKQAEEFSGKGLDLLLMLEKMPQISIAAVNGFALGGGCEFAMGCDLIYASENAKFGQPEVSIGVTPGFGGTQRLQRLVGPMKAREMIFTGNMVDANEAYRIGLVSGIFPKEKLMEEVEKIAKTILSKSPEALQRSKAAIREGAHLNLEQASKVEKSEFAKCFDHPNQKEGMKAFLEKRKPNWSST